MVDEFGSGGILVEVFRHLQRHEGVDQHPVRDEAPGLFGVGTGEGADQPVDLNHAAAHGRPEGWVGGGHETVQENE